MATATVIELTAADLEARLRNIVRREAEAPTMPDPCCPNRSHEANLLLHAGIQASFRQAAATLEEIAQGDWLALHNWTRQHENMLANACGRVGGSQVAAHKLALCLLGGPRSSLVNGVMSTSFVDCYDRLLP